MSKLMGLAVYNNIILDLHFPPCCYKKLLTPPITPRWPVSSGGGSDIMDGFEVGIFEPSVEDLIKAMPVSLCFINLRDTPFNAIDPVIILVFVNVMIHDQSVYVICIHNHIIKKDHLQPETTSLLRPTCMVVSQ